jgi:hypothetical protein
MCWDLARKGAGKQMMDFVDFRGGNLGRAAVVALACRHFVNSRNVSGISVVLFLRSCSKSRDDQFEDDSNNWRRSQPSLY